jgi:hypothetical protein
VCVGGVKGCSQNGCTALLAASQEGHIACARLLVKYGSDKEARNYVRANLYARDSLYEFLFDLHAWSLVPGLIFACVFSKLSNCVTFCFHFHLIFS